MSRGILRFFNIAYKLKYVLVGVISLNYLQFIWFYEWKLPFIFKISFATWALEIFYVLKLAYLLHLIHNQYGLKYQIPT